MSHHWCIQWLGAKQATAKNLNQLWQNSLFYIYTIGQLFYHGCLGMFSQQNNDFMNVLVVLYDIAIKLKKNINRPGMYCIKDAKIIVTLACKKKKGYHHFVQQCMYALPGAPRGR